MRGCQDVEGSMDSLLDGAALEEADVPIWPVDAALRAAGGLPTSGCCHCTGCVSTTGCFPLPAIVCIVLNSLIPLADRSRFRVECELGGGGKAGDDEAMAELCVCGCSTVEGEAVKDRCSSIGEGLTRELPSGVEVGVYGGGGEGIAAMLCKCTYQSHQCQAIIPSMPVTSRVPLELGMTLWTPKRC